MSKKKRKPAVKTFKEIAQVQRGDWGNVKPYTRIYEDKRRKRVKHKEREDGYYEC